MYGSCGTTNSREPSRRPDRPRYGMVRRLRTALIDRLGHAVRRRGTTIPLDVFGYTLKIGNGAIHPFDAPAHLRLFLPLPFLVSLQPGTYFLIRSRRFAPL